MVVSRTLDDLRAAATRTAFRTLNSVVRPVVKAGVGSPWPIGMGVVVIETTGRVSGEPREVPLVAIRCGNRVDVSTVRSGSQWARNLEAGGDAFVWLHGRRRPVSAEVAPGPLTRATLVVGPEDEK